MRKLTFAEFFSGCSRLTAAVDLLGWDVFCVEKNGAAAESAPVGRLIVKDFLTLNHADLPRLDFAHFSPDCTSNSRLRRNDDGIRNAYDRRCEENDYCGDHRDPKASDFNDCMLKIIDIINDQMKRPGQDFKFTLEQPDGGKYPEYHLAILKNISGAEMLQLSFCRFHSGYIERVQGKEVAGFCNKPTLLWTNCRALIDACHGGLHRCARRSVDAPRATPCQHYMRHTEQGGVREDRHATKKFPHELAVFLAQMFDRECGERRYTPETYARVPDSYGPASACAKSVADFIEACTSDA